MKSGALKRKVKQYQELKEQIRRLEKNISQSKTSNIFLDWQI